MLYLRRLSFLLSIEVNQPRAWFAGPLGPHQAWFTGIYLISEFKRVIAPEYPTRSPIGFVAFKGGQNQVLSICALSQPVHVKCLLSGMF